MDYFLLCAAYTSTCTRAHTHRLVDHFLDVFKKHTGVDLGNAKDGDKKKKALNKLRTAAAQLKVDLSRMTESDIWYVCVCARVRLICVFVQVCVCL